MSVVAACVHATSSSKYNEKSESLNEQNVMIIMSHHEFINHRVKASSARNGKQHRSLQ